MALFEYDGRIPKIGKGSYIAESAEVIGDVTIGDDCYIGPKAILRGDYGTITIGNGSAIEEGAIVHARPMDKTTIGKNVTIGHGAMLHNCTIDDYAVIGMRATVSDYAKVEYWGVVAEGSVVINYQTVEKETVVTGVPAKPKTKIDDNYKNIWSFAKKIYQDLANNYPKRLKRID